MRVFIDGNNSVHQDYHASGTHDGQLFRARLRAIFKTWQPTDIVVAFDSGRSFRHGIYSGYKSGRQHDPEIDLAIDAAHHACTIERIESVSVPTFEADDIIATLCESLDPNDKAIIVSGDKDLHQLLEKDRIVQAIKLRRSGSSLVDTQWRNADNLIGRYGVTPAEWVDFRIITGDASDKIGGIPGVGDKGAIEILGQWGSLDAFYESPLAHTIGNSLYRKMLDAKHTIETLRELITLRRDVPMNEVQPCH